MDGQVEGMVNVCMDDGCLDGSMDELLPEQPFCKRHFL